MRTTAGSLLGLALAGAAGGTTFTVVNTLDAGGGSLRQAILDSNATFGPDQIAFAIPGSGVHTIALASALPTITDPVIIDGYTQPGSSPNTQPMGGLNTVLTIEIDGTNGGPDPCLTIAAGNGDLFVMAVQGLVINRCGQAIRVSPGGDEASIAGNFIGTDPTGTFLPGPIGYGVAIDGADGVLVGGSAPFERNLIALASFGVSVVNSNFSAVRGNLIGTNAAGNATIPPSSGGNSSGVGVGATAVATIGGSSDEEGNVIAGFKNGILLSGNASLVRRNRIGTDATGTVALGNTYGVYLSEGATSTVEENVISGNLQGILIEHSLPTIIGNFVGTDVTGTIDLGNADMGIFIGGGGAQIGGTHPGDGNTIAFNGWGIYQSGGGVVVYSAQFATPIRGNRIFGNTRIGIDLEGDGVTPNDESDLDEGPNGLQNYPLITIVAPGATTTHVEGRLQSKPSAAYDIDFFQAPICNPRPHQPLQAEGYLGVLAVATDASGIATFSIDLPGVLDPGRRVVATATDGSGRTSELSTGMVHSVDPQAGPAGGAVAATIQGELFEPGATVLVGSTPAVNVNVQNASTIVATMPALPAGTPHPVTVTNLNGTTGTLSNGWLANFLDVPEGHAFYDHVVPLVFNGISGGIGGGLYGVDNPTLRQQMAVFLLKAKHGVCYAPPPCAGVFSDVACPSPFADWIEALAAEGITGGCGAGRYCPQNPVRRDQMAVFLLKAEHGASYAPPACTGTYADVTCPSLFADWIEQLAVEGITSGCGGGNYCPLNPNTRGQMAVFITKTFHLQ